MVAAGGGQVRLVEGPRPQPAPAEVLVAAACSVVSPGTERSVRALASSNLLAKARARPDLVRQVVRKARSEGPGRALEAVRDGLAQAVPLGYSSAGTVLEVGAAVAGLRPGQRVAAAGAGHADLQLASGLLVVPLADEVPDEHGAFAALGAIALHAVRIGEVQAGSHVVVVGMGVIGRLVARVAAASGASVLGVDVDQRALDGPDPVDDTVLADGDGVVADAVAQWTRGRGADVVIVAAADGSGRAVGDAPALLRDRGGVVVVGDAELQLDRRSWYERALRLELVRSYGPGRYDPSYEQLGIDYPAGYVPWTAGRNLETFVELVRSGRIEVAELVGERVPFDRAEEAYDRLAHERTSRAPQLVYAAPAPAAAPTSAPPRSGGRRRSLPAPRLGIVGAGTFVRRTALPALAAAGWDEPVAVASRSGRSAAALGVGAPREVRELLTAEDVDVVAVLTSHDAHAELVVAALEAGKHVWCEKPLALDAIELARVEAAAAAVDRSLLVGFNRRHSAALEQVGAHVRSGVGPLVLSSRMSLAELSDDHWYHDRRQGGRLLGEVGHHVDAAIAVVAAPVRRVHASGAVGPDEELLLADHLVVVLEHVDGSLSTIATGRGHPSTAKERLEVVGRGHTAVVDDFRAVELDGRRRRLAMDDAKGHVAQLRRFRRSIVEGVPWSGQAGGLHTSHVLVAAAESLLTGQPVVVGPAT